MDKTALFIKKAKEKHGDKYDYSKVDYVNYDTKIIIICSIHGDFEKSPGHHLRGQGCLKCSRESVRIIFSKSIEKFIIDAKNVHGNKYDYSKVNYVNKNVKVIITCLVHGDFSQSPDHHLRGQGCSTCGGCIKKDTEQFITASKIIHGDKYDYSKTDYVSNKIYVIIICSSHGEFEQTPDCHLSGKGCVGCGRESTSVARRKTTEQFITDAESVHGNRYSYSKTDYDNSRIDVIITCQLHGDFSQSPTNHLSGKGCPVCGGSIKKETSGFITDAKNVHENKYNYSKVDYINSHTNVIITCSTHGDFQQSPTSHLNGCGCPYCVNKTESIVYQYLDSINIQHYRQFSPSWLINTETGYRRRFDLLIPKYKLIIEIDGPQHFRQVSIWGSPEIQRSTDVEKMFLALENDYSVVRLLQDDIFNNNFEWRDFILKNLIERAEPEIVYQNNTTYNEHETLFYEMAGNRYSI